jgi:ABC-type dipeptide/oligopeptide/nickel transport system permease component
MNATTSASANAWAMIEKEKQRDRLIRRISISAWTVTFIIVLAFVIMTGMTVAQMVQGWSAGALPFLSVLGAAIPLFVVLGMLSVLIATLSTIGIFLRQRAASLNEIQLRLAALEEMLAPNASAVSAERR